MSISREIERTIADAGLDVLRKFVSFEEMQSIFDDLEGVTQSQGAAHTLLKEMEARKVKPAFTTDGFHIASLDSPNIECPPRPFLFEPAFGGRPSKSVGNAFYPLVDKANLRQYFAHLIRWFPHPIRPGVMLPLRLDSYYLTVDHPVSRIYVDVPVILMKDKSRLNYIRVSLTVFETILDSQVGEHGRVIELTRTQERGERLTVARDVGEPYNAARMWQTFGPQHHRKFEALSCSVETKPEFRKSALIVADHLIKL
tara:strand:+ start:137976 stop:138743 length:768 start_codon:yes stop_codon:yes gene_type:complete